MKTFLVSIHTEVQATSPQDAAEQVRDVIAERANDCHCTVTPQAPDGGFYHAGHVHVTLAGHTYH